MKRLIIFTDLDETLLERHTYSFEKAEPALSLLREKDIPMVIVSSKTMAEIEHYRRKLDNRHPFIAENGSVIFVPEGYFTYYLSYKSEKRDGYMVITLGAPYKRLRRVMAELQAEGFNARGFGDMTTEEISRLTNLTPEEAALATQRHFDEPFTCDGCDAESLGNSIRGKGLHLTQGRLFHLIGDNDKGKAVDVLKELYRAKFGHITTAALGDSPTDIPMLKCVDCPIAVQKDDGSFYPGLDMPNLIRADGIGPAGWNSAVMELIRKLGR
jgi:mannosyl-3-phosphoglycerate phosphatase